MTGRHGADPFPQHSTCAPLSRQENEVLDEIEHGLIGSDLGLSARMARLDDPAGGGVGASGRRAGLRRDPAVLVMALPAVAGWALVGLAAAAVFLPVLLSAARWPFRA